MPNLQSSRGAGAAALMTVLSFCLLVAAGPTAKASDENSRWEAVRTGSAFAIMRHALAPGTGDPDNFTLGDCSTQRNLSDDGRHQAAEIGDTFRKHGIPHADVVTSEWCRCRETAELLRLGPVTALPPLNSFFGRWENRDPQTTALRAWLAEYKSDGPLVLVTHQVNISALTGTYAASGEIVVVRRGQDGEMTVLGTL